MKDSISIFAFPTGNIFRHSDSHYKATNISLDNDESRECIEIGMGWTQNFWVQSEVNYSDVCKYDESGELVPMPIEEVRDLIDKHAFCHYLPEDRCASKCDRRVCAISRLKNKEKKNGINNDDKCLQIVKRILNLDSDEFSQVREAVHKSRQ